MQSRSIVYEPDPTCTRLLHAIIFPRLQLADEQTGGEQAHALWQDVFGHDVDERREEDKGHGSLVDEEEGDELGHSRLKHRLSQH